MHPFENPVILEVLVRFFDFRQTLSLRLVSPLWNQIVLSFLRRTREFVFHVSILTCNKQPAFASGISNFISSNQLNHGLLISLVFPRPWMYSVYCSDWLDGEETASKSEEQERLLYHQAEAKFYAQMQNDPLVGSQVVSTILSNSGRVTQFLLQMSLEMVLKDIRDVELFNNIFAHVPMLKKLALELFTEKDDLIQKLGPTCLPMLETFAPRISFQRMVDSAPVDHHVTEATWKILLSQFAPSIKYLDLEGWGTSSSYYRFMENRCERAMRAIQSLFAEARLPHLCGVRMPRHCGNCYTSPHATLRAFTVPLTELYLRNTHDPMKTIDCLRNFESTLVFLDIHVQSWHKSSEWDASLALPALPRLKSFTASTQREGDAENHDIFGFGYLFQSDPSQLASRFPCLTSLTLFYTPLNHWGHLWVRIFPEAIEGVDERHHNYPQIEKLCLSLVAECEDTTLQRILVTFPSLRVLRHMEEAETEGNFGMCAHSWLIGRAGGVRGEESVATMVEDKEGVNSRARREWEETGYLACTDAYVFNEVMTPSHAHYFWSGPSYRAFL